MLQRYCIAILMVLACLAPALSKSWLVILVQAQPRTSFVWCKQAVEPSLHLHDNEREMPRWSLVNPYNQQESIARFPDGSLRFSSNGGQNWPPLQIPAQAVAARAAFALSAPPGGGKSFPATLFLFDCSLWRSHDQGSSFQEIYQAPADRRIRTVDSLDALPGSALLQLDNGQIFTTLDTSTATPSFGWTPLFLPHSGQITGSALRCAARGFCYFALTTSTAMRFFRILPAINQFDEQLLPLSLASSSAHLTLSVHPVYPNRILLSIGANLWSAQDEDGQLAWSHEFNAGEDILTHGIKVTTAAVEYRVTTRNNTYTTSCPGGSTSRCFSTADAIGLFSHRLTCREK